MQNISKGEYSDQSKIRYLPIIDLNPTKEKCIYSTLLFIQEQAKKLNIVAPCLTFDKPLWIKTVEITKPKSINVVYRLGFFHLLMSFVGSIGVFKFTFPFEVEIIKNILNQNNWEIWK